MSQNTVPKSAAAPRDRESEQLRILAALLAHPAEDALDALRDLLPQAPWLADCIAELEEVTLERWQGEHTRLFLNGWPATVCPPFESAYRQGQMGGTSAAALASLYRRAGLQADGAPPDYLGTMLECAAWLAEQEDGGELLRELQDDHLGRWVPRFARNLRDRSELLLYRTLGGQIARIFPETEGHD